MSQFPICKFRFLKWTVGCTENLNNFLARARHVVAEDLLVAEGQEQAYYGLPNVNQESCSGVELCPQLVLTFVSGLGAAFLLASYIALTQQPNGKKKRRALEGSAPPQRPLLIWLIFLHGM